MFVLKTNLLLRVNLCGIPCGQINQHILFELTLVDLRSRRFQNVNLLHPLTYKPFWGEQIFESLWPYGPFPSRVGRKRWKNHSKEARIYVNKSLSERVVFSKTTSLTTWWNHKKSWKKHRKISLDAPAPCVAGTCALIAVWWVGRLALVGRLGPQKAWGGSMF